MFRLLHQLSKSHIFFTRPLILLVYVPIFFVALMSSNALGGGQLTLDVFFSGAWNYEVLALLTYLVAVCWDKIRSYWASGSEEDTFEFIIKYSVSLAIGVLFGIEIIKAFGSEFVFKTLLLELPQNIPAEFPPILIPSGFILFIIAGFRSSIRQQSKRLELELLYRETKFQSLKLQLNPHFLFNALNMISAEIEEDPASATHILDEFAELLRGVLRFSGLADVSLGQECALIGHYLSIQNQRFPGRITASIELCEPCKEYRVPPLLFQPLVENAFIHGFEKTGQKGYVQVSATETEDILLLQIIDNGQGFDPKNAQESTGIIYVREVLELFYQKRGSLHIQSTPGQGTTCSIQIQKKKP